ncbi:Fpg/Nei family DNA glycosylase [Mucilaginibacter ginkgonis]|uniref:Fpg/Nei family DNA glycosylase n=1 Tax=Mucilaginibacter ginkgonis TaxID=2682091 RepID=A0A6I4HZ08_9SPHI|nr:DNA-formamidopyrimidine glycosylase family protein [Mucilaginibacter ginkgonis]QQL48663.1 Fpg/Nei family DNA glycosylase [Mucilaginibacter ginkgonis]
MPELPDLQVFARNLDKKLGGKTLERITVNSKKAKTPNAEFAKALHGQKLKKVYRDGKELFFDFDEHTLGLHLMLHGQLFRFDGKNEQKYTVVEMIFKGGEGLALTDWQGAANPTLDPEESKAPDAFDKAVTPKWWQDSLGKKKSAIKNVLLDQKFIRGIGNAYADEILYDAGISPMSVANKIPADKVKVLAKSVKKVLEDAEKQITKSKPDIISGEVRDFLKVHHTRKGETDKGEKILVEKGSRKTYYTEGQELYK